MADHNDPNAVNSIFSDIDVSAADLYDIFGFPSSDMSGGEKVVIALTFAAAPQTGVFDSDMMYRIMIAPDRRLERRGKDDWSLEALLAYLEGVRDKYLSVLKPSEVRVTVDHNNRASLRFLNFPGGSFSGGRRNQPAHNPAISRRARYKNLCRRKGRRLLQRSAGLFSVDQLCPAILSRAAHDA
jgi:hypothetical protein